MRRLIATIGLLLALCARPVAADIVCTSNTLFTCGGVTTSGTNTFAGANSFLDGANFQIKNVADTTKKAQFDLSGITTGTTRTFTLPNFTTAQTLLSTGASANAQSFAGVLLSPNADDATGTGYWLGAYNATNNGMQWGAVQTPDTGELLTGSTSNSFVVMETADRGTDQQNGACGSAACAHPSFTWMSATAASPQTNYNTQAFFGNAAEALKTLTESVATSVIRINVAAGAGTGGILEYGIFAADATDQQLRQSSLRYSVTNKAGTETCTITTMAGAAVTNETNDGNAASISSGTLTYGITVDTTPANACDIAFNAVSSLTQTTLQARYQVRQVGPGQVIPQ